MSNIPKPVGFGAMWYASKTIRKLALEEILNSSLRKAAKKFGVAPTTLSRIANNVGDVTLSTMLKIETVLIKGEKK